MSALMASYESKIGGLLEAIESQISGPEWLATLRRKGLEVFREHGVPTPKNEEWKYTPLRPVAESDWTLPEPGPAVFGFELPFVVPGSIRAVMVNGRLDRNLSEFPTIPGLTIQSLHSAIQERPDLIESHLGGVANIEEHPFAALNTAMFHDGLLIHMKRGLMVEPVIEVVHIASGEGQVIAPRILIVAEDGSSAKITERYITDGEAKNLVIPVSESVVGQDALVERVRFQDESQQSIHIGLWEARQQKGSQYLAYNVAFGGQIARLDQNIYLAGEHAVSRLDGVAVAQGSQLIDNHTKLDHAVPNCNSFEVYKQIIDGQATIVFNGKIMVHQDAQKTDAKQTNQALLLSPDATINSKPQLEIFADDVKCTHGATVGQLESTPLFYLMSRGVPKAEAQSILVYAFAAEVLELISITEVKDDLEARLFAKLGC